VGIGLLIAAASTSSSSPLNLTIAFLVTTSIPYLIILALCLVGTIVAAYRASVYRRRFRIAIALFPFWIGLLPIQIFLAALIIIAERSSGTASSSSLYSNNIGALILNLVFLILAIMPFFYALFLPLIDRAATRLMSLPKDK
jgi:F0F1-type ATP synthase assembly protein I